MESAAEDGKGGCSLAVSASLPFADELVGCSLPLTVSSHDVSLLDYSHRHLIVRVHAPRFQALVLVAHGLDSAYGVVSVKGKWDVVSSRLTLLRKPDDCLNGFVDANCRVCENDVDGLYIGQMVTSENKSYVCH